jgi:hypothetical protein
VTLNFKNGVFGVFGAYSRRIPCFFSFPLQGRGNEGVFCFVFFNSLKINAKSAKSAMASRSAVCIRSDRASKKMPMLVPDLPEQTGMHADTKAA